MLQKELNNDVPDTVLQQCPHEDRLLAENLLRLAQAELLVLNLASTTVTVDGNRVLLKCALTGPSPVVSLSSMRALQAYSPARVLEVRSVLSEGILYLLLEVSDSTTRITTTELEIVRITKKRRLQDILR